MPQKEIPAKQTLSAVAQIFGKRVRPEWRSFKLHSEEEKRQAPIQTERTELLSYRDLAERLGTSEGWVRRNARRTYTRDPIPAKRLGKNVKFDPQSEEFKAWLKRRGR
jgi:hypothetical protein